MPSILEDFPDDAAESGASPRQRGVGPVLFPRLTAEQYRARVWRYVYILMRLGFIALVIAGTWWLGMSLDTLLVPLLGSFILAYLLNPLVERIQSRGLGRTQAIIICLGSIFLMIALLLLFLLPAFITQISDWIGKIPALVDTIADRWIPWINEQINTRLPPSIRESVEGYASELPAVAQRFGAWGIDAVSTSGHLLFFMLNLILIPLFTYYFLDRFILFKTEAVDWVPIRRREYTLALFNRMDKAVGQWFRGQLLVAAIVGALYALGLGLVFGFFGIDFKLGVAIGIASGLTNIIPYFGMILAIVLTALVVLLNWPGWIGLLFVVGVFVVNHILEAYFVSPKVLGDSVDLNPIVVIILLLAGGELAGIWGILLIIPIAGAIKVIVPDLRVLYHQTAFYRGGEVAYAHAESEQGRDDAPEPAE